MHSSSTNSPVNPVLFPAGERNNVFDKRGPFRFHIPEERPSDRASFITPSSPSLPPSHLPLCYACRYLVSYFSSSRISRQGQGSEWCISALPLAWWRRGGESSLVSTSHQLIPFQSAFSCPRASTKDVLKISCGLPSRSSAVLA